MKKIVLMVAAVVCVAFSATAQEIQVLTTGLLAEQVMQEEFVKINAKELPQAVIAAIAKTYEQCTVKEAFVGVVEGVKRYKIVLVARDQKEQAVIMDEQGLLV